MPYTSDTFNNSNTQGPIKASKVTNVTSAVNGAFHQQGASDAKVDRIRINKAGRLLGTTTPSTTTKSLLKYRDIVLKAARTADLSITNLFPQENWRWIRLHNIDLGRYMAGKSGGLRMLREEPEADNEGFGTPQISGDCKAEMPRTATIRRGSGHQRSSSWYWEIVNLQ